MTPLRYLDQAQPNSHRILQRAIVRYRSLYSDLGDRCNANHDHCGGLPDAPIGRHHRAPPSTNAVVRAISQHAQLVGIGPRTPLFRARVVGVSARLPGFRRPRPIGIRYGQQTAGQTPVTLDEDSTCRVPETCTVWPHCLDARAPEEIQPVTDRFVGKQDG